LLLVVDNGSVYTQKLFDFLLQKNIKFEKLLPDKISFSNLLEYNSFVLSGRRKNNQLMNAKNSQIIKHALSEKKPLLGICYGAEILALTLGGTIKKTHSTQKGNEKVIITQENSLCKGELNVFESHNYEISHLNNSLIGIAKSKNCMYEIIKHKEQNIFGTQFHPEMSSDGQNIIVSFINLIH